MNVIKSAISGREPQPQPSRATASQRASKTHASPASDIQIPWYLKEENEAAAAKRTQTQPTAGEADPWYVSGPYRGTSKANQSEAGREHQARQLPARRPSPSNGQPKVTPPTQPVIIPFLALPPPGPAGPAQPTEASYDYEEAWAQWPPNAVLPGNARASPQALTGGPPPGAPRQQFRPPPVPFQPVHVPDEPTKPVRLFQGCVEDDTCPFGESNLEIYCYYEGDDTKYYQCSPHADHGGLWVIRRCPGGLVFVGDRCDRPKRHSTNPNQVELTPDELEYEYVEYEIDVPAGTGDIDYYGTPTYVLPAETAAPAGPARPQQARPQPPQRPQQPPQRPQTPARPTPTRPPPRPSRPTPSHPPRTTSRTSIASAAEEELSAAEKSYAATHARLQLQRQQLASQQAELQAQQSALAKQIEEQRQEQARLLAQQQAQAAAQRAAEERARLAAAKQQERLQREQELEAQRQAHAKALELQRKQQAELKALEEQKAKIAAQRSQLLAQQRQAQEQARQLALLRQQQLVQQKKLHLQKAEIQRIQLQSKHQQHSKLDHTRIAKIQKQKAEAARLAKLQKQKAEHARLSKLHQQQLALQQQQALQLQQQQQQQAQQAQQAQQQALLQQQQHYQYQNLFGNQPQPTHLQSGPETSGSLTQGRVLIPPKPTGYPSWQGRSSGGPPLSPGQQAAQIFPPFFPNPTGATLTTPGVQQTQFPLHPSAQPYQPHIAGSASFRPFAGAKRAKDAQRGDVSLEAQPCSVLSPPRSQLLSGPLEDDGATFFMCIPGPDRKDGVWAKLRCPKGSAFRPEKQICL